MAEQPLVQLFEACVSLGVEPLDVLLPFVRKAVQVEHARDGNGLLEVRLLEEEPAHDFRSQVRVVRQIGRALGEMQQDRARFHDRAAVFQHEHRHA